MCGGPAALRCVQCRGVWYCGPKCQRAAWGAHKSACAAAVAAAAQRESAEGLREARAGPDNDGGGSTSQAAIAAASWNPGAQEGAGDGVAACAMAGSPRRCGARCRGVAYCGPKCQRAAWGAHKLSCAAAVAASAARGGAEGARETAGTSGGGGGSSSSGSGAPGVDCDGGTGGIDAATLRDVSGAVAMLGSRKATERAAGAHTLCSIKKLGGDSNRKLYEFQAAVVAAGGIALLVRVLESRGHDGRVVADAAYVVRELALYSVDIQRAFAVAGAIPALVALLLCQSVDVQVEVAVALRGLGANDENCATRRPVLFVLWLRCCRRILLMCRKLLRAHCGTWAPRTSIIRSRSRRPVLFRP